MLLPTAHQFNPALLILECGMAALATASAFAFPRLCGKWFRPVERGFAKLPKRRALAVIGVGLSVIVLRPAILPLFPVPLPFVPDDFSFLLAADTFAHGRLANPTPAMWTHFESIHITMHPTYQSMYFPGQGLLLAASRVILGSPWIGLLILSTLMCAAAIGLQMMRHLRHWKPEGKPVGLTPARLTVTICILMAGLRVFADPLHIAQSEWPPSNWNFNWFGPGHFGTERARMQTWLDHQPGKQLVNVRYWGNHYPTDEWVYNAADIDHSNVIWARDGDSAGNQELLRYYRDRNVWLIEPDAIPARVSPYLVQESK